MNNTINPHAADIADEINAGREFPARAVIDENGQLIRWDHNRTTAWLNDVQDFWLAAAQGYLDMAKDGCLESIGDARDALAKANAVTPKR